MASSGAEAAVEHSSPCPRECALEVNKALTAFFAIANVSMAEKINIAMGLPGTLSDPNISGVIGLHETPHKFKAAAARLQAYVALWKYAVAQYEADMSDQQRRDYEDMIRTHLVSRGQCIVEICTHPRKHLPNASEAMCFSSFCEHCHAMASSGAEAAVEHSSLCPRECVLEVNKALTAFFAIANVSMAEKINIAMGLPGTLSDPNISGVIGLHETPHKFKAAAARLQAYVALWKYAVAQYEADMSDQQRRDYEDMIRTHLVSRGQCIVEICTHPRKHLEDTAESFSSFCDHCHAMAYGT